VHSLAAMGLGSLCTRCCCSTAQENRNRSSSMPRCTWAGRARCQAVPANQCCHRGRSHLREARESGAATGYRETITSRGVQVQKDVPAAIQDANLVKGDEAKHATCVAGEINCAIDNGAGIQTAMIGLRGTNTAGRVLGGAGRRHRTGAFRTAGGNCCCRAASAAAVAADTVAQG
jgi:hypothetical protein